MSPEALLSIVREAALERITDQRVLGDVAKNAQERDVSMAAVARIADERVLGGVAKSTKERRVREAALKRMADRSVLADVAKNAEDQDMRKTAEKRAAGMVRGLDGQDLLTLAGAIRRELLGTSSGGVIRVRSARVHNGNCWLECIQLSGNRPRAGDKVRVSRTSRVGIVIDSVTLGDVFGEIRKSGGSVSILGDGSRLQSDLSVIVSGIAPNDFEPGDELIVLC
jgi:hypothetical protein